jgi:hypothetical protein
VVSLQRFGNNLLSGLPLSVLLILALQKATPLSQQALVRATSQYPSRTATRHDQLVLLDIISSANPCQRRDRSSCLCHYWPTSEHHTLHTVDSRSTPLLTIISRRSPTPSTFLRPKYGTHASPLSLSYNSDELADSLSTRSVTPGRGGLWSKLQATVARNSRAVCDTFDLLAVPTTQRLQEGLQKHTKCSRRIIPSLNISQKIPKGILASLNTSIPNKPMEQVSIIEGV